MPEPTGGGAAAGGATTGGGRGGGGSGGGKVRGGNRGRGGGGGRGNQKGNNNNPNQNTNNNNKSGENNNINNSSSSSKSGGGGNKRRNNNNRRNRNKDNKDKQQQQSNNNINSKILSEDDKRQLEEAKLAKEAEAKRIAEAKRLAEQQQALLEARKERWKSRQALQQRVQDSVHNLQTILQTVNHHTTQRTTIMTSEALVSSRQAFEREKKKFKSDLKKCTTFCKKIKAGTAWSMTPVAIQNECNTLNLTRYVEEVSSAILDSPKWKLADLPTVVALCSAMHARYKEFVSALLLPGLWNVIKGKKSNTGGGSNPEEAKLRRLYVRLIVEFILTGIVTETKQLVKLMGDITGGTAGTYAITDANLVVSFCKAAGFELLGRTPKSIQHDLELLQDEIGRFEQHKEQGKPVHDLTENVVATTEEIPVIITESLSQKSRSIVAQTRQALTQHAVPDTVSQVFLGHCMGAYETLVKSLVETHTKLQKLEKRCEQDRLVQGSLSEAREKGLADARKLNESLLKSVETLSDVLNQPVPILQDEDEDDKEGTGEGGPGVELWTNGEEGQGSSGPGGSDNFGPFDDEETRSFYCDIPDLLTTIPPALLGMNETEIERLQAENLRKYGNGGDAAAAAAEENETAVEPISEAQLVDEEEEEAAKEGADKEGEGNGDGDENKDTPHYKLMVLLEQELPECNRREQVDEIAEKFCVNHGSSKNSRKRLSKTLFLVPRTRLDLLPYYSRMAAIIDRIYPDVIAPLTVELEQQFHGQAKFKKNVNPEGRMKTARYLGELTKFRVAPPIVALRCIRRCLDDFSGVNIDVACCMLESCGRYLYRTKYTVAKLTSLMETMMRIAKAKHLDERSQALINSAFYMVKPPPAAPRKLAKVYPPLEAYLRHLLLVRLEPEESSVSMVTKQLLKFPWNDPSQQCGELICRIMLKACRRGRYKAIAAVASVAAIVRRSKPEVAVRLVDSCLEEIQWALEHPSFRDQQRTVTYARLLGELYTASLVTAQIIIDQLYRFVNHGHEIPQALHEASAKYASEASDDTAKQDGPVSNSAGDVSQAIQEDEEMEDANLDPKEERQVPKTVAVSKHSKYDPRVPSPIDPPNSVFRVKLVCTLLEVSAKTLVTRNNLPILEGFAAAFQRYLFTKVTLPTEVEFALLDTFDILDSQWRKVTSKDAKRDGSSSGGERGFTRYDNWTDAHNATVAKEEEDAQAEQRSRARLEALAGFGKVDGDVPLEGDLVDDVLVEMEEDEESDGSHSGGEYDSDEELEEDAGEQMAMESVDNEMEVDEEFTDEEDSEDETDEEMDDEDFSDEEEIDEEAYMKQLEEEAFERELRRMTMDSLEKGKNLARASAGGKVADYMPSGSQFIRKKATVDTKLEESGSKGVGGQVGVSFQLLKKGNKGRVEAKELIVPKETNLAKLASKQDDEAAREHDVIKARVLQYEAESAEQESTGGNVYLEQTKLQVIRNRQLSMEDIDRNFGTARGDRRIAPEARRPLEGRSPGRGGGGRIGRGGGRGRGGRTLKNY